MEFDGGISNITTSGFEYEVFLSFRGPDTRSCFTDHLYVRFIDAGIRAYRDDEELRKGENIGSELLKAIKDSKIAIPIFSKNYAASKWCLKELAQMVECKRSNGLKVMPIFYDVTPYKVRHQTEDYAEAFERHEKCYDEDTIKSWKAALKEVGELSGWDLNNSTTRFFKKEGELVKEVTKVVLRELKKDYLITTDYLVGVEHHVKKILGTLSTDNGGVLIFGIYGMGGIGKTTLAKVIYNRLLPNFQNHSFLNDIGETHRSKGTKFLKFLCKSLIRDILGKESANISNVDEGIRTIRERFSNKKVIILLDDVDEVSQLKGLIEKRDWFGSGSRIIITTRNKSVLDSFKVDGSYELDGLETDLAIQLFSKHAFRNDNPPKEYLDFSQKAVQIAGGLPLALEVFGSLLCGKSSEDWDSTLKKIEKFSNKDIRKKLNISFEALDFQEKEIFLDIVCFFIGEEYRIVTLVWDDSEEAIEVLQQMSLVKIKDHKLWVHDQLRDLGREIVQKEHTQRGKRSRLWNAEETTELFMGNVGDEKIEGICLDFRGQSHCNYISSDKFARLPNLRLLRVNYDSEIGELEDSLEGRPFCDRRYDFLPCPGGPLVFSKLRWFSSRGFPGMHGARNISFDNLVILDLSYSSITSSWGGWSGVKMAKNLKVLKLTGCKNLVKTPDLTNFKKLKDLSVLSCPNLVEIPGIVMLENLVQLQIKDCAKLQSLPSLSNLKKLQHLEVRFVPNLVEIPGIGTLENLEILYIHECPKIQSLPSLSNFKKLKELIVWSYPNLVGIPSIDMLENLEDLSIRGCAKLQSLPLSNFKKLKRLAIRSFPNLIEIPNICMLEKILEKLHIQDCAKLQSLPSLSNFKNLKLLVVQSCPNLVEILGIGMLENLVNLQIEDCAKLQSLPCLSNLKKLQHLEVQFVPNLVEIPGIGMLENLEILSIENCAKLQSLPGLSNLKKLKNLEVRSCPNLVEITGKLESLSTLELRYC